MRIRVWVGDFYLEVRPRQAVLQAPYSYKRPANRPVRPANLVFQTKSPNPDDAVSAAEILGLNLAMEAWNGISCSVGTIQ